MFRIFLLTIFPKKMKFLFYNKTFRVCSVRKYSISVHYLLFGSHLNMKIFGLTVEYYAKTYLFSKYYGNDSVPTITLKLVTGTITKRKNVLLFRSTDERTSV